MSIADQPCALLATLYQSLYPDRIGTRVQLSALPRAVRECQVREIWNHFERTGEFYEIERPALVMRQGSGRRLSRGTLASEPSWASKRQGTPF
jgi:hypothetical protein